MKLVSMKLSKEQREGSPVAAAEYVGPEYPYGLEIMLGEDELKKLGVEALPEVGSDKGIVAQVCIKSVSENERVDDAGKKHSNRSMTLQITALRLGPKPDRTDEEKFYGEGAK